MELDLTAIHKDRPNEILYVECKAKEKIASNEILAFEAKVRFKNADYGYFIRTKELDHQVAGLVTEMKGDPRYKNITFFEPEKIIEILNEQNKINTTSIKKNNCAKQILAITYLGDYLILIKNKSLSNTSKAFYLYNAITGETETDSNVIALLQKKISEINGLVVEPLTNSDTISSEIAQTVQKKEEKPKIAVLIPEPINKNLETINYNYSSCFSDLNVYLWKGFLNMKIIRQLDNYDYIFILTESYKGKIYIEDEDLKAKLISVEELVDNLVPDFKCLIIQTNN